MYPLVSQQFRHSFSTVKVSYLYRENLLNCYFVRMCQEYIWCNDSFEQIYKDGCHIPEIGRVGLKYDIQRVFPHSEDTRLVEAM